MRRPRRWRQRALHAIAVIALAQPTLAWPLTIEQLLALPLERLVQLEFTPTRGGR